MGSQSFIILKQGTRPDWAMIGASLANAGSDEQLEFFRAFVKECKTWGTNYQVETQLAHVNAALTADEKSVLSMLGYAE